MRATQFHELTFTTVRQMAKLPLIPVPSGFRFQPVDAGEVAARLVELALGPPSGLVPDIGGPRVYAMAGLVRSYLRATGKHRPIMPVRIPGKAARAIRDGANLTPDRAVGRRSWEDFLAAQVGSPGEKWIRARVTRVPGIPVADSAAAAPDQASPPSAVVLPSAAPFLARMRRRIR